MPTPERGPARPITMADSDIGPAEVALVNAVLQSRALSCGPMLEQFEQEWAERMGVPHAVAVSSGTAGLHLSLIGAGVDAHDLVVTTPYSFVASANVALYQRAVPVFVDIDPETLNIDPGAVKHALSDLSACGSAATHWLPRRGAAGARPARAVLPVHVFGRPAAMESIVASTRTYGAQLIEDACEAIGAEHQGQRTGTFGDAAVFGFFPNKPIAMGEGGVIATPHADRAALFRSLRNQGRSADGAWLEYTRLGFNYRLDDMSAALGLAQLRRLDELLAKRERVAACYTRLLTVDGVSPIAPTRGTTRMSWFVYVVRLAPDIDRAQVMAELEARGIPSRPYFPAIHLQPFYRERFGFAPGDFPHAEAASRSTLALPFHANMPYADVERVAGALLEIVARSRGTASPVTRRPESATTAPRAERTAADPHQAVVNDFLPRPPRVLPMDEVRALVGGRRVLVTGAGGSIGSELCRQLVACDPALLVMLDRYENGLQAAVDALGHVVGVLPLIADVTDAARLGAVMRETRPDLVIHAAAHKHVPLMEHNAGEAVKNNVTGTRLVLEAALESGVGHFVLISTDKAVHPTSVMGATKRLAEQLARQAAARGGMRVVSVRFGNVIGSNGSVLHTFLTQVRAGGPVTVTHPDVRRYFMRVSEAAQLVLHAAAGAPGGSIAVLDLGDQMPIVELARHIIRSEGLRPDEDIPIVFSGLRPGEKLSEELVRTGESKVRSHIDGLTWVSARPVADWSAFNTAVGVLEGLAAGDDADATRRTLMALAASDGSDQSGD